jgi:hypothetical protein
MAPDRLRRFTPSDVMQAVAQSLRAERDYLAETPDDWIRASMRAQLDATQRSIANGSQGPEGLGDQLASWAIERADRPTRAESIEAALVAAATTSADDPLARDLDEFVRGYLDGTINDDEYLRRLRKPRAAKPTRRRARAVQLPAGALTVSQAERTLMAMIAEAGVGDPPDPRAAWEVFKAFAARRVVANAPWQLDSDLGLFQWGVYDWHDGKGTRFQIDFTRQFALLDEDGDYDHMEQLACTLYFAPTERLRGLGSGEVWSDGELWADGALQAWSAGVEATGVLVAIAGGDTPIECRVGQEQV